MTHYIATQLAGIAGVLSLAVIIPTIFTGVIMAITSQFRPMS